MTLIATKGLVKQTKSRKTERHKKHHHKRKKKYKSSEESENDYSDPDFSLWTFLKLCDILGPDVSLCGISFWRKFTDALGYGTYFFEREGPTGYGCKYVNVMMFFREWNGSKELSLILPVN